MPGVSDVRDARPEDLPAVLDVVREAFGDEGADVAAIWTALDEEDLVRVSLVAERDGQLVGHVASARRGSTRGGRLSTCWC